MSVEAAFPPQSSGLTRRLMATALIGSFAGTIVVGAPLYYGLAQSMWWIALASVVALLGGGFYLGWETREAEPLYGSVLAFLYFSAAAIILIVGTWMGKVPDPMPGLATGDSTFFFVWPLMILAAGVAGSILGGKATARSEKEE
jgi:hypothetical protein